MTADILRVILAAAGAVLVLGIYLWERHRRLEARVQAIRRAQEQANAPEAASGGEGGAESITRELERLDQIVSEHKATSPGEPSAPAHARKESKRKGPEKPAKGPEKPAKGAPETADSVLLGQQGELPLDGDAYWLDLPPSVPFKIVQINVVSRKLPFSGGRIEAACRDVELMPGDMNIYHRYDRTGKKPRVMFSMANLVKPGQFPINQMAAFSTPGLSLFAQLPGPRDSLAIFSDMLFTAERLAAMLDGDLQDETHSALTRQTIEHTREQILEHRRQIQLARKKKT